MVVVVAEPVLEEVADESPAWVVVAKVAEGVEDEVVEELEDDEASVALRVPQLLALALHFSWPSKSSGWRVMH